MSSGNQEYDPFEPGRSTPEFEQFARENYRSHARHAGRSSASAPRHRFSEDSRAQRTEYERNYEAYRGRPVYEDPVRSEKGRQAKSFARAALVVLLAIAIEIFGFNFSFFSSMFYDEVGEYLIDGAPASSVTSVTLTEADNGFEITGLDDKVRSIHFQPQIEDAEVGKVADDTVQIVMYLVDEGNSNYYALPAVTVDPDNPASTYVNLDPAGNCHSIKVTATNLASIGTVVVDDISINARVPFSFEPLRLLSVLLVLTMLSCIRPASRLYSTVLDMRRGKHKVLVFGLVVFQIALVFALVHSNTFYVNMTHTPATENYFQYQKLAEALLQGQLYLSDVPSDALVSMSNPYDTQARIAQGVPYLWDHAYFEGRYYVYFGVLPCLVFYVPWLLATGTGFPTWLGVAICDAVYAAGLAYLLFQICRRWFPRTSIGVFLALDVMLFIAGGGLILARTPSMYFLPEAMGLACVSWGLGLWVRGTSFGWIENRFVIGGAALFACTLATRPQMVLGAVFGLLLFWPFLRDSRGNSPMRASAVSSFCAAMVPFLAVGLAVLAYNALRFGSPFDFGANYNLTTNDMTHRGFHFDRIPFGLYAYLFQPPSLGSQFPFLRPAYLDPAYQGVTIYEPMYGGYFFLYPMTLAILAVGKAKRGLSDKGLFVPAMVSIVVAFVLCIFDLQGAGILMRYICDFGIYFALPAALVFLELLQVHSARPLTEGWTTDIFGGGHAAHSRSGAGEMTVSVYRIALYFLFASLLVTVIVAVLLWDAFGMY